ncbi:RES family NAD+ phosphorylase [Bradyrhizobium sp. WYCCWR 13022]|uniref:RES family NAD+ phosphorylase n=1 Tax=unclassified Bradyrhizobium TaxID=2631580 RepID=UPI00263AE749|nr:RES family NAD+ phosphorylase [Bradyrhizobium sp. WYCCWR 13022]MDN4982151.1 RES family NAD+ phosphorylase [Bradyrhizobium sp. WYCCWR 13022]
MTKVCSRCLQQGPLRDWILEVGSDDDCDFDSTHTGVACVEIDELAEEADRWFQTHYQPGDETYEVDPDPESDRVYHGTYGQPYEEIFAEELGSSGDVLQAVLDALPDASHHEIAQGGERYYTDAYNFEPIENARAREKADQDDYWFANRYTFEWEDFCKEVQFSSRFFGIKERLDALFGKPEEYGEGPVRPLYELAPGQTLYRARLMNSDLSEQALQTDGARLLGAPPASRAQSGRMNVEFIPVFYATFADATAIAELRPSIGDSIAIGRFTTRVPLKVFDFTVFDRRAADRAHFYMHSRYEFIEQMQAQISRPVRPHERQREYIATQIVAEYLKSYFGCDAVIFKSSMQRDGAEDNRNIVILHRDIFVADDHPGVVTYVDWSMRNVVDVRYTVVDGMAF